MSSKLTVAEPSIIGEMPSGDEAENQRQYGLRSCAPTPAEEVHNHINEKLSNKKDGATVIDIMDDGKHTPHWTVYISVLK